MWVLLMLLLNTPGRYVLNTFETEEACLVERHRVGYEMAAAYPHERDFVIECRYTPVETL